ncbi:hypothetical protein PM082_022035 [Marasmius tenuissimus]|nr:hypothetical protein PM082_022035 [Marasmius tenuissimus]
MADFLSTVPSPVTETERGSQPAKFRGESQTRGLESQTFTLVPCFFLQHSSQMSGEWLEEQYQWQLDQQFAGNQLAFKPAFQPPDPHEPSFDNFNSFEPTFEDLNVNNSHPTPIYSFNQHESQSFRPYGDNGFENVHAPSVNSLPSHSAIFYPTSRQQSMRQAYDYPRDFGTDLFQMSHITHTPVSEIFSDGH